MEPSARVGSSSKKRLPPPPNLEPKLIQIQSILSAKHKGHLAQQCPPEFSPQLLLDDRMDQAMNHLEELHRL